LQGNFRSGEVYLLDYGIDFFVAKGGIKLSGRFWSKARGLGNSKEVVEKVADCDLKNTDDTNYPIPNGDW